MSHDESVRMRLAYENADAPVELITFEGAPHAFWYGRKWGDKAFAAMLEFLETTFASDESE